MSDDLEPLSTDPNDFCIIDTETRSTVDVTVGGAYNHTANCRVVIVTYAIGNGPVQEWVIDDFTPGRKLAWADAPADLASFRARVIAGGAWFVAWNAAFDRLAMSRGMIGRPFAPEHFIDAMAQGVKSHLPPDLMGASIAARVQTKKQEAGKRLIALFSDEASPATPQTHPEEWEMFRSYARDDVAATQELFFGTLPLSRVEWEDYWTNERINDRGLPVDLAFARGASALAEMNARKANADIEALTGGAVRTVNQAAAILDWIRYRLRALPEVDRILTREITEEPTEDGEDTILLPHFSLERTRVEELIAYLDRIDAEQGLTDEEWAAYQVLEVRLYGASATPRKFTKMIPLVEDGRLKGQYVFNGAPATGRFSSRGLQVHNLSRATIGSQDDELDAIEAITEHGESAYADTQKRFGPIGRTLTRLIRPVICAPSGHTMMWMDWSAIEARVLPWLAGPGDAERVLGVFNTNDADPSLPDIYKVTAGGILNKPASEVTKSERQSHGKVPCIAEGQLVLTDKGLVPIERVDLDMRVWDGVSFVSHRGSVCKGTKDVWEYQGLVATADHIVWTEEEGQCQFLDAASRGLNLVQSGDGRSPLRVGDNHQPGTALHETGLVGMLRANALQRVCSRIVAKLRQSVAWHLERLPGVLATASCAEMAGQAAYGGQAALHQPGRQELGQLWRSRGRVSIFVSAGGMHLGAGQSRAAQGHGAGPHRQLWPLRSRKSAMGDSVSAKLEQAHSGAGAVGVSCGGLAVRVSDRSQQAAAGQNAGTDSRGCARRRGEEAKSVAVYRGTARVYDIVNAGPLNRFTVSDRLVHNCLALGFAGGNGALFAMARAYGAAFTEDEATGIVQAWRQTNPWAVAFWAELWDAVLWCLDNPGQPRMAGRVTYLFDPDYFGGTMFCVLPCGRALLYPHMRWEERERKDKLTGKVETRIQLTYRRGRARAGLHKGVLAENITQATAASILRHSLRRLGREAPNLVVGHTHDEIVAMTRDDAAAVAAGKAALERVMLERPDWADGLPLKAELSLCEYYTKTID